MGWYLKKSLAIGPLRLNLSKSGLGASIGVRGLRVSRGPRGVLLNAGRNGIYYRSSLNKLSPRGAGNPAPEAGDEFDRHSSIGPSPAPLVGSAAEHADHDTTGPAKRQLGARMLRSLFGGLFRGH